MADTPTQDDYRLHKDAPACLIEAPDLPYRPRDPNTYRPAIGMIGCGGISETHLEAYVEAGYNVAVLCDLDLERARLRRRKFYPDAEVTSDYADVLGRRDIEVVDIATHPEDRTGIIRAALEAGKHVLSQKPFVTDLDVGEELVRLASARGVKLAVNQNGRWAPHLSYMREAVRAGLIGDLLSAHVAVHWDHTWTVGTPFENVEDLMFYDFGIHWFDFVSSLMGNRRVMRVQASKSRAHGQKARPPMLAQAIVELEGGQASLIFDGHIPHGPEDHTYVGGTRGSLVSSGPDLSHQTVTLTTEAGVAEPNLEGTWFPGGFHGTMGELLCSIEEDREPMNGARENLRSLALCFAAIAAANDGCPKVPGEVLRLPD